jgi:hypothetical protein
MNVFVHCVARALPIFVQDSAKQVHVQHCNVPARVEKKKVVAPKSKLMWRRKEVQPPSAKSSRAVQEGGHGVVGKKT